MARKRSNRLFLRGGTWYCWGYDSNGKRWIQTTHQREERAAELAARDIERQRVTSPNPQTTARNKVSLQQALQAVLDFQVAADRGLNTSRATRYHAEHLVELLGTSTPLEALTLGDTSLYLQARLAEGASRHTIKKELGTLTQAIRRVTKLGLYVPKVDPTHLVPDELGKAYTPRERWMTWDEYQALLRAMQPYSDKVSPELREARRARYGAVQRRADRQDHRDYVIAWCNLGLRRSELFDIQPQDYDPVRQELRVRGTKTREADRLVPVNKAAAEVLTRRLSCQQPFPVWFGPERDLARACARAKIRPVTCNDFRRTFCSWLCQAGVPESVCANLLGHTSTLLVRSVYGHLDRGALSEAVRKIGSATGRNAVTDTETNQAPDVDT